MKAVDILRNARALLEDPKSWDKGVFARDKNGHEVEVTSKGACMFCANGAIMRTVGADKMVEVYREDPDVTKAVVALGRVVPRTRGVFASWPGHIARANDADNTTHADVLSWFDRAIAALEEKAT